MPGDDADTDADFGAYLAARWSPVVRTTVLLRGCSVHDAQEFASAGFTRCCASWGRIRQEADLDTEVWAAMQDVVRHRDRALQPADPQAEPVLSALLAELDRLGVEAREVLVLTQAAGLDEEQVAELLDVGAAEIAGRGIRARGALDLSGVRAASERDGLPLTAAEAFRLAAEAIDPGGAPHAEIVARARADRARRRRLVGIGVLVGAVLIGGTWLATRSSDPDLPPATVRRETNPIEIAWYADGVLHLADVTVEVPGVAALVESIGGVVYADDHGDVAFVGADGIRRRIGRKATDSALVGDRGAGWAAWVDPGGGGTGRPALMVYDVARGTMLVPRDVPPTGVRLIAIDQREIYFATDGGTYTWDPVSGVTAEVDRGGLADVESATRVYQVGRRIDMVQPFFNVHYLRPGVGAQVAAGGLYAISRTPPALVSSPDGAFWPLVYDVRSGDRMPSGLAGDERAVDATIGASGAIVYLVSHGEGQALVLRRCTIRDTQCADLATVPAGSGPALLGR